MRINGLAPASRRVLNSVTKTAVVVGLAAAMTVPAIPAAQALNAAALAHFAECARLLLSDPEAHAEICLPSNVPPSFRTLAGGAAGPGLEACSNIEWRELSRWERKKVICIKDNWDIKFPKKKRRYTSGAD